MVERAYAKINLALEVLPKRDDNYHEVVNLMVPIDLYDKLYFEEIDAGIELESTINIKENFVYKAAKLFMDTYGIKKGVKITLEKRIPIAAGLAGGSSDAAACLRGLNRLFKTNIPLSELAELSKELGSDMPYCVYSVPSLCYGRGEIVKPLNISFNKIPLTLIRFKFGLSTSLVYKNYVYEKKDRTSNIENIIKGLRTENITLLNQNIFNDLESSAHQLEPYLSQTKSKIEELGYPLFQSGSGPTHFILKKNINKKLYLTIDNIKAYQTFIIDNPNKMRNNS